MNLSNVILCDNVLFKLEEDATVNDIVEKICLTTCLTKHDFYLTQNGKILSNELSPISRNLYVNLRHFGGKGGFGSMLRAIGAQIEKTTNREACRDLSGRRLRDINEEKRLKSWLDKQKDREAEAEERKKRKIAKLLAVPKHEFKDSEYESERSQLTEKVSESVEEGFKNAALKSENGIKRKAPTAGPASKKAALWIGDDLSSSSDTDSSDSDTETSIDKPAKVVESDSGGSTSHSAENAISSSADCPSTSETMAKQEVKI